MRRGVHNVAKHQPHGPSLPLRPGLFIPAQEGAGGWLSRFMRRTFCTDKKPRGFENYMPRSHLKGDKVPKASNHKLEAGGGGANGGPGGNNNKKDGKTVEVNLPVGWLILGGVAYYLYSTMGGAGGQGVGAKHEISFQEFRNQLLAKGKVQRLEVVNNNRVRVYVRADDSGLSELSQGPLQGGVYKYHFQIGSTDALERKLDEAQRELQVPAERHVPVKYVNEVSMLHVLLDFAPTLLLLGATYWLISRQMRQMTGGMPGRPGTGSKNQRGGSGPGGFFGMGKANTTTLDKGATKVTFKDVAGCDEAKMEIMEFVQFLQNPDKFKILGAKLPKGALLVGPPGSGKTLLAKATAGEAGVPFLSISGSDFQEMFVGVGPARVRDLFAQARSQSPSMLFIDEIDAIGRQRGRGGAMGGNDERENTLNQLLVEMDGFASTTGIVVLAGTNRPDILDKALLRPGRFDRMITVDTPDVKGREQIFRVHLKGLKLAKPIDYYAQRLAALSPGMAGADIANVCNEAALVAARFDDKAVDLHHFEKAIDRVIGGLEKKNKVISPEERRTVALHESGHAVVSWFLEHAEPLLKVSIVPRGSSVLGFAQYLPNESLLMTKEKLLDQVCAIMGGRAAEQVMIGKISTGATNDLERVTQLAYSQVAVYGMNEKVGLLSYRMDRDQFDKPYSNETAQMIDHEVRTFVDTAYKRTVAIVEEKKELVQAMAKELLDKEVINFDDVERLLGKRPFISDQVRNIDRFRYGGDGTPPAAVEEGAKEGGATSSDGGSSGGDGGGPAGEPAIEEQGTLVERLRRRLEPGAVVAV